MNRKPADLPSAGFSCTCGHVQGHLRPASRKTGTHLVCFCADCRAAQIHLSQPDPVAEGVALFQTTPDTVHFSQGKAALGLLRLSRKGLLRWYATCCNAPLFNTLAGPKLPFVALHVARLDDPSAIGPVRVRSFVPQPGKPPRHQGAAGMVAQLALRMGAARLSGRWRQNPFFDRNTGKPIIDAIVLDKAARAALNRAQRGAVR